MSPLKKIGVLVATAAVGMSIGMDLGHTEVKYDVTFVKVPVYHKVHDTKTVYKKFPESCTRMIAASAKEAAASDGLTKATGEINSDLHELSTETAYRKRTVVVNQLIANINLSKEHLNDATTSSMAASVDLEAATRACKSDLADAK